MRLIITGGHLTPALATIEELKKVSSILFIGHKHPLEGDPAVSVEYQIITQKNLPFVPLITGRLQRKFTRHTIPSLLKIPIGFLQALWMVGKFKPDIILSFGGYVSLPVVVAGFLFGVPIIIHEQTPGAGLSNKIAALFARRILISWEESRRFFPKKKTVLTGNPVREEVFKVKGEELRVRDNLPMVYVTGGSLGSHIINAAIEQVLGKLLKKFTLIHQTGNAREYQDFERLMIARNSLEPTLKERYFLTKYIEEDDIGWVLNRANLVVGRAGANTISELLALGKPALLIPLPFSQEGEQQKNAFLLKKTGLGEILLQKELTPGKLWQTIQKILANLGKYEKNKEKARNLIKKDAARKITEVVLDELSKKEKRKESL